MKPQLARRFQCLQKQPSFITNPKKVGVGKGKAAAQSNRKIPLQKHLEKLSQKEYCKVRMNFILLSAVFIITIGQNVITGSPPPSIEAAEVISAFSQSMAAVIPAARRFGSEANPAAYRCAASCDQELKNVTEQELYFVMQHVPVPDDHAVYSIFDTEIMTRICGTFNETEACLARCPESELKTKLNRNYGKRRFECCESTFVSDGDCMKQVAVANWKKLHIGAENQLLAMGDRSALTSFWENYAQSPSLQTMMLNKDAETFDEQDRNDVLNSLPDLNGMRVVEIGSGIGRFTEPLAQNAKHVLATDFMKPFIDKNRELHAHLGNVDFVCANAAKLDLEPENCDLVFTNWLLMYLTDVETVDFLTTVLIWLKPNGWLHLRESCSESSKKTSGKTDENPTHYRHICQYLPLIEKLRVKDEKSGRYMRFEVMWAKSIEIYVQAVGNWRQVHTLIKKVWTDPDENLSPQGYADLVHELDVASINERDRIHKDMAARKALWQARSPFEPLFLKFLKDKLHLTVDHGVLNMCLDTSAAVSPFAIAEEFGCAVVNLDTNFYMYDYNLAMANAAADKRLRFHWIADADQSDWHLPKQCFDLVVACHLSAHVTNFERALKNLQAVLVPGGKIVLMEKAHTTNGILDHARHNGFASTVALEDISNDVKIILGQAINDIEKTPELQQLRHKYEQWLKAIDGSVKWYLLTASHGY